MPAKFKFQEGEKVLCFHGPLLYEAKCVRIQVKEKQVKYFVHYQGWNKSWDEWVPEQRVLKVTDANLQKQKELQEAHNQSRLKSAKKKAAEVKEEEKEKKKESIAGATPHDKSKSKTTATPSAAAQPNATVAAPADTKDSSANKDTDGQRKKRSRAEQLAEHDDTSPKMEIKITIPDNLKQVLVDDWDLITRQKKLVQLKARHTVNQILDDYVKQKNSSVKMSASEESIIQEVANGIKEYFNVTLGSQLLYKFERPQYQSFVKENKDDNEDDVQMSSIYGAQHLLRFFVKLGSLLAATNLDDKSSELLLKHIYDFLEYLERNSSLFSVNDYVLAAPEYIKKTL